MTSLPDALFNGGSQTVVEGSVFWLYCQVNSRTPTVTATWTKDSVPLVQDVPHIRMRSSCLPKVLGNSHEENCQECFLWLVSENQLVSKFTESISVHCSSTRNIDAANHHTITLQKRFAESAFHDACRTFSQALGAVHI